MNKLKTLFTAACAVASFSAFAELVARWDFNNYDSTNPTSPGVLKATVGSDAIAASGHGSSTARTDGTIGGMTVVDTGLGANNYALAIPYGEHLQLPLPASVRGKSWTIRMRFYAPTASAGKWRCFLNSAANDSDGGLFINTSNKLGGGWWWNQSGSYGTTISSDAWHTLAMSATANWSEVVLDGTTKAITSGNNLISKLNADYILLAADNDTDDNLLYFDYVEIYNETSLAEELLPNEAKSSVTGEWTFPAADPYAAKVGKDLVTHTRTGSASFTPGTDGVLRGDGHLVVGRNNGLNCYHGLPANSSWTLAMDVRVPDNENKNQTWHSIFKTTRNADGLLFFRKDPNIGWTIRVCGHNDHTPSCGITPGTWARVVIKYINDGATTIYYNGEKLYEYNNYWNAYKAEKGGYFMLLADEDGEDWDTDISYVVIHDRALSETDITTLYSRPGAQDENGKAILTEAPAGLWSGSTLAPLVGAPLADGADGSKVWTRTSAPASATYVADLTLAATQTAGGGLVGNTRGAVSGIYGSSVGLSGRFTTTTVPAVFTGNYEDSTWGYWTIQPLDRTSAHRVAVTCLKDGRVRYYVDGRLWSQRTPNNANASSLPTEAMTFFKGLGATVTRLAAYDRALLPDEVSALGAVGEEPSGTKPTATITASKVRHIEAQIEEVSFTAGATSTNGDKVGVVVDFGDGTSTSGMAYEASGVTRTFTHTYQTPGLYTVSVRPIAQGGVLGDPTTLEIKVVPIGGEPGMLFLIK